MRVTSRLTEVSLPKSMMHLLSPGLKVGLPSTDNAWLDDELLWSFRLLSHVNLYPTLGLDERRRRRRSESLLSSSRLGLHTG